MNYEEMMAAIEYAAKQQPMQDQFSGVQDRVAFDAARFNLPQSSYSSQMSINPIQNQSPVNPVQPAQSQSGLLDQLMKMGGNYQGLSPMTPISGEVTYGGGMIAPVDLPMTPAGSGMMGVQKKDDGDMIKKLLMMMGG